MTAKELAREAERYDALWQSITHDGIPFYAGCILNHAAVEYANNIALIFKDKKYSYHDLNAWANRCAYQFKKHGAQKRAACSFACKTALPIMPPILVRGRSVPS